MHFIDKMAHFSSKWKPSEEKVLSFTIFLTSKSMFFSLYFTLHFESLYCKEKKIKSKKIIALHLILKKSKAQKLQWG